MAKPNYQYEKRQKDLAKQRKKQEKEQERAARKATKAAGGEGEAVEPAPAEAIEAGATAPAESSQNAAG